MFIKSQVHTRKTYGFFIKLYELQQDQIQQNLALKNH